MVVAPACASTRSPSTPARSRTPPPAPIMTPVYLTSTYVQDGPGEHKGYEYSRTQNPTRNALEACLAALEGAKYGAAFASGLAATDMLMHMLDAGDHVVVLATTCTAAPSASSTRCSSAQGLQLLLRGPVRRRRTSRRRSRRRRRWSGWRRRPTRCSSSSTWRAIAEIAQEARASSRVVRQHLHDAVLPAPAGARLRRGRRTPPPST